MNVNPKSLKNLTYRIPKGNIPWNKGTKGVMKAWNKGKPAPWAKNLPQHFKKGFRHTEEWKIALSERMKGKRYRLGKKQSTLWKKTIKEVLTGKNNHNWKGNRVGYRGLHYWVIRNLGKAQQCDFCGKEKTTPKSIQWANKSREYKRDLTDWIQLCAKCHTEYDKVGQVELV